MSIVKLLSEPAATAAVTLLSQEIVMGNPVADTLYARAFFTVGPNFAVNLLMIFAFLFVPKGTLIAGAFDTASPPRLES
jgi:hypothetical protein